jgi:hypothetical protein
MQYHNYQNYEQVKSVQTSAEHVMFAQLTQIPVWGYNCIYQNSLQFVSHIWTKGLAKTTNKSLGVFEKHHIMGWKWKYQRAKFQAHMVSHHLSIHQVTITWLSVHKWGTTGCDVQYSPCKIVCHEVKDWNCSLLEVNDRGNTNSQHIWCSSLHVGIWLVMV